MKNYFKLMYENDRITLIGVIILFFIFLTIIIIMHRLGRLDGERDAKPYKNVEIFEKINK